MSRLLFGAALGAALLSMAGPAFAHGGIYRGPKDVVPPRGGGSGGRTPGAAGPATPGPSGPSTPGPAGPATPGPNGPRTSGPAGPGGPGHPSTGGPAGAGTDLNRWEFWWEFNKDPFIRLKEAIHVGRVKTGSPDFYLGGGSRTVSQDTLKPTEKEIMGLILPRLKEAMDTTDNRDINSSCMIAMAKIGRSKPGEIEIIDVFRERLTENDQEIRETAALSMGISQMTTAIDDLTDLVLDTPKGRQLVGDSQVGDRTRTFAAYGLGLIGQATNDPDDKRRCLEPLAGLLGQAGDLSSRNLVVGLVNAIGILEPDVHSSDPADQKLLEDCVKALETYYNARLGTGEEMLQSHVPPAIAKLLGRNGPSDPDSPWRKEVERWKERFAHDLLERGKIERTSNDIRRSCAIALGRLCEPVDDPRKGDGRYARILLDRYGRDKNEQTRYFSLMALGQMGGDWCRAELMKAFARGKKALEKPWAALALGVHEFHRHDAAGNDTDVTVDEEIGRMLSRALEDVPTPAARGAFAVALGLAKYRDASDQMRSMLIRNQHQSDFAGYLCVGLALMDATGAKEDIREVVDKAVRRPVLLRQGAIALGKLGDKEVADQLLKLLEQGDQNLAKYSAIASALGLIGDRHSIEPLVEILFDTDITELTRAFAAVALGGVADKEPLPWNSKIGANMNYRAAVETLTDGALGILDIL